MDFAKAFDKVSNFLLGKLLLKEGIPSDIVYLIMHYLRNQTVRITWDRGYRECHRIDKVVRQGDILSPLLSKLYIDDLISDILNMSIGCCEVFLRMNIIAYSDDIVILSNAVHHFETLYHNLVNTVANENLELVKQNRYV